MVSVGDLVIFYVASVPTTETITEFIKNENKRIISIRARKISHINELNVISYCPYAYIQKHKIGLVINLSVHYNLAVILFDGNYCAVSPNWLYSLKYKFSNK